MDGEDLGKCGFDHKVRVCARVRVRGPRSVGPGSWAKCIFFLVKIHLRFWIGFLSDPLCDRLSVWLFKILLITVWTCLAGRLRLFLE